MGDITIEEFWVIYLNRSNRIIDKKRISQGGINGTVTDIKVIMKNAIEMLASSFIICHNHPSGNLTPSTADHEITKKIKEAAGLMDIQLLDHIIVTDKSHYSFADEGII